MNYSDLHDTNEITALLRGVAVTQTADSPHDYRPKSFRHTPKFPHGEYGIALRCEVCEATGEITGPEALDITDEPEDGSWPWKLIEQRPGECPGAYSPEWSTPKEAFEAGYRSGLNEAARRIVEFMDTLAGEPEQPGHELAIEVHPMVGPIGTCSCSKFSMIGPVDLVTQFHALHVADPAKTPTGREAGA